MTVVDWALLCAVAPSCVAVLLFCLTLQVMP
jgi:hypothetical protein